MTRRTSDASSASVTAELPRRFLEELRAAVGAENVLTDPAERWTYGYDNSRKHAPPDVVAFAAPPEQGVAIVRLCNEFGVPIVARGRGTGTAGSAIPIQGGLVLSLERMDRILTVDP